MLRNFIELSSTIASRLPYGRLQAAYYIVRRLVNECRSASVLYLHELLQLESQPDLFLSEREDLYRRKIKFLGKESQLSSRGYVIVAPSYMRQSAGIHALYQLCHDLNSRNYPSFVTGSLFTPKNLLAPLISKSDAKRLIKKGFIAVYPEIVVGNPLAAPTVARWVLNKPGFLGGDPIYSPNEKVFYYAQGFKDSIKNKVSGQLYLPTIDETIFFDHGSPAVSRTLNCFYIGKSRWVDGIIDRSNAFEITRKSPKREELGKLFRACKTLYCFDNSTILTYEALLCGCEVVIIPDGTQLREDYENSELGMDGIQWGVSQPPHSQPSSQKINARHQKLKQTYHVQLNQFIEITQNASQTGQNNAAQ